MKRGIKYLPMVVVYKILLSLMMLLWHTTSPAKEVFKTFKEINQLELVNQAGLRQQYVDQSVSLNLAFPSVATPKWLNKVHFEAWKKGVKTLYYTRTESVLTWRYCYSSYE
jgi:ribonucleotide reductase alpha subunit